MINKDEKYIKDKVSEYISLASKTYNHNFENVEVKFNLSGVVAGMFIIDLNTNIKTFKFNIGIYELNDKNFDQTILHEVAHYISNDMDNYLRRIKPHGKEWKNVVSILGGIPQRCHNLKIPESTRKNQRKYEYKCKCRTMFVSKTVHNRMRLIGKKYYCTQCKGILSRLYE